MAVGGAQTAVAAGLNVAAVFETLIEEPWVNQIHVALVKAKNETGIDYVWSESVKSADFARVMREYAEKGVLAISNMSDQSSPGPDTVITGPVWDMWPTVKHVVNLVNAGVFTAQDFGGFSFMGKGGAYLAPYHKWDAKLPADVKALVAQRTKEILDGTFRVDIDESIPKSN